MNTPGMNPLAAQLADIIEPSPVGWFPPAWGWWVLLVLLLAVVGVATWWVRVWLQQRRLLLVADTLLDQALEQYQTTQDSQRYCQSLNQTMKRYWKACAPTATHVLSLSGSDWVEAVLHAAPSSGLSQNTQQALAEGAYQPLHEFKVNDLDQDVRRWLRKAKPANIRRASLEPEHV